MTPVNLRVTACANGGRSTVGSYPAATSLLILCDGGGSNSARTYLFKADLEKLVQDTGLSADRALPPYTSKYNPIEHRLFPHLTRACQGVIFTSVDVVQELMAKATTKTGLEVSVNILNKEYATGRKVAADFKEQMGVIFDADLPQWNYRLPPREVHIGSYLIFDPNLPWCAAKINSP